MPILEAWNISTRDWIIVVVFISFLIVVVNVLSYVWSSKKPRKAGIIIYYDNLRLVSVLTSLGGSGVPEDMNNRIDLYERFFFGRKKLLLTTFEVWNDKGYSLVIVKSTDCRLDNAYIEQITRDLLPAVTFPGSRMKVV